jgi:hypothetical protein
MQVDFFEQGALHEHGRRIGEGGRQWDGRRRRTRSGPSRRGVIKTPD